MTEYFILLPQIMFLAALFNVLLNQLGWISNPFYISEILPFMYEGFIVAINGVRE